MKNINTDNEIHIAQINIFDLLEPYSKEITELNTKYKYSIIEYKSNNKNITNIILEFTYEFKNNKELIYIFKNINKNFQQKFLYPTIDEENKTISFISNYLNTIDETIMIRRWKLLINNLKNK